MATLIELIQAESGTPAQIAAAIKAKGLTVRDIPVADLKFLLRARGMLVKQVGPSGWLGSIPTMVSLLPDQAKLPVQIWLSHITDPDSVKWETTNADYSKPFYDLYQAFDGNAPFNSGDFDAIYALGGGLAYESLTAEQVQAAIEAEALRVAAAEADAAWTAIENDFLNPARAANDRTVESLASALQAAANAIGGE